MVALVQKKKTAAQMNRRPEPPGYNSQPLGVYQIGVV
jgi:hypothetical protein